MNAFTLSASSAISRFAVAALVLAMTGCAGLPPGQSDSAAATAPGSADSAKIAAAVAAGVTAGNAAEAKPGATPASVAQAAGAAAAAATGPKPFADVVKDAKETKGLFTLWQKDEKVWIEIAPEQFGKPFLFTANLSRGVGEQRVYGGMMLPGTNNIVEFKRIGNTVQLIARNYAFTGGANAAIAQGVREGFTDSLVGATTVASQPHPQRKTVLIDANALLLTDIPVGDGFTTGIHMRNYTFDAKNSSFEALRSTPDEASFTVSAHYTNPKATLPPTPTPTPPPPNPFPPFENLPDGRSLFLGYTYNIVALPEPMAARRADPRVGHFATEIWDFSTDTRFTAKTHYVDRWRLEKKDPDAALSEPKRADRVLDRPERAGEIPSGRARRHPRVEQGVREDRLQECDRREAAGGRRRRSTRSMRSIRRCAGSCRRTPASPSARRRSIRARARFLTRRSAFLRCGRAATARSSRSRRQVRGPHSTRSRRRMVSMAAAAPTRRTRSPRWTSASTCWRRAARSSPAAPRPMPSSRLRSRQS